MSAQYQHERQALIIIDKYHRDAIRAAQLRLARETQLDGIASPTMWFRAAITTMVTTIGMRLLHRLAVSRETGAAPTFTGKLTDTVVTA